MKKEIIVLCVIPTLGHGGAQKIMVDVANYLSGYSDVDGEFKITVLTLKDNSSNFYDVDAGVDLDFIDVIEGDKTSLIAMLKSLLKLHKYIKNMQPDIILSFQDIANFLVLIGSLGTDAKVIVSERQDTNYYRLPRIRKIVRSVLYRLSKKIVVQTSTIGDQFPAHLKNRVIVIPNHVEVDVASATPKNMGIDGFLSLIHI